MLKKTIIFMMCLCLVGCSQKEIKTIINDDKLIAISYPVTNIKVLDNSVLTYINQIYNQFKNEYKKYKYPELNISYTYKEINENILNVGIFTEISTDVKTTKVKTFTYNKKTKKFLVMEDLMEDIEVFDYDLKKQLLKKYQELNMEFLSNISYDYFTFDDTNLTLYFNPIELNSKDSEFVFLDIPLITLNLLIDIDKFGNNDIYLNLKEKDILVNEKVVALTFDDGPSKYTEEIIKILKENDAYATFFVVGNKVDFYKDILVEMIKNGNEIGNHTYSHKWLDRLTDQQFKEEIENTQDIIKKTTGFTPLLFRPTYGGYSKRLKEYTDLTFVLWDVDSNDWKVKNKDKIYNNVISNCKNRSIILMHDIHKYTVDSLESIIKKLKEEGYNFVTVSELLKLKEVSEDGSN